MRMGNEAIETPRDDSEKIELSIVRAKATESITPLKSLTIGEACKSARDRVSC